MKKARNIFDELYHNKFAPLYDFFQHLDPTSSMAPKTLFRKLIRLLLLGEKVDVKKIKKVYLEPELEKKKQILTRHRNDFLNKCQIFQWG